MSAVASPFCEDAWPDVEDAALVERAQAGSREALDELLQRHQRWIYNVVLRMIYHPQDAEDATQEILIKAVTKLSTFERRSRFRTWLYRIACNHVLNMKRGRMEPATMNFADLGRSLDGAPDLDLPDPQGVPVDVQLLVDETRLSCTMGMLLCLDRKQRLAYVLGEIFGVTDSVGAQLLETSRENFRQKLSRARKDLHSFMDRKCGLVNRANPCRCAKKTRAFMKAGYVNPDDLLFARSRIQQVREVARRRGDDMDSFDGLFSEVYREHPFHETPSGLTRLKEVMDSRHFKKTFDLG